MPQGSTRSERVHAKPGYSGGNLQCARAAMDTRYFEMVEGPSSKFWEISGEDVTIVTRFGRIGTGGQSSTKIEADATTALRLYDKLILEKVKKGYVEGGQPTASPSAPAVATPGSFLASGRSFAYEMADFDVADRYRFTVERLEPTLVLRWEMDNESGTLTFADAAIAKSRSFLQLSQGSAMGSDQGDLPKTIQRDLPPFLLSRKVYAELQKASSSGLPPRSTSSRSSEAGSSCGSSPTRRGR
jgi:predicted DNA-binding WGR domain protein